MENELELIARYRAGDPEAFGKIYDYYFPKLYNFIYYKVHSREDSEDLVSEVFHRALKNMERFSPRRASFSTWLYAIARNLVIDHYRHTRPTENIKDYYDIADGENISEKVSQKLALESVEKYLAKLDATQREIVMLRVWEGLSFAEIAEIVGKKEPAVKMAFARTVNKLGAEMLVAYFISLTFRL